MGGEQNGFKELMIAIMVSGGWVLVKKRLVLAVSICGLFRFNYGRKSRELSFYRPSGDISYYHLNDD
jgi:hypothetical protein